MPSVLADRLAMKPARAVDEGMADLRANIVSAVCPRCSGYRFYRTWNEDTYVYESCELCVEGSNGRSC